MYIIRDIIQVRFGAWKDAKALLDQAYSQGILPDVKSARVLTDFTGDNYRLIFEEGYDSLAEYEKGMIENDKNPAFRKWNEKFKQYVISSQREILRQLL